MLLEIYLAIQFIILGTILSSLVFKWKKRYFIHGFSMFLAVVLYLTSFALIPIWFLLTFSTAEVLVVFSENFLVVGVSVIHALLGVVFGFFAARILDSWRLRNTQLCIKNKKKMKHAMVVWGLSFVSGILLTFLLGRYIVLNFTY
ncbi:MAG: hypothetical protein P8Y18_10075 [Candidatus Bathyarchaeota archaeon]